MYSAIVLCGGKNSRLKSFNKKITKPLIVYKKKNIIRASSKYVKINKD